jgi:ribosomal protein S27E
MPERFIHLKCRSCGAQLDIYDDMTRFACGYCGTEMLVERRGGTVALRAIEEVIHKVQIGTDKTAAELALIRLRDEREKLSKLLPLLSEAHLEDVVGTLRLSFVLLTVALAVFSLSPVAGSIFLILTVLMLFWAIPLQQKANKKREMRRQEVKSRLREVDNAIAESKKIVDSF